MPGQAAATSTPTLPVPCRRTWFKGCSRTCRVPMQPQGERRGHPKDRGAGAEPRGRLADLFESNNNDIKGGGAVSADNYGGRNLYFGIREHAMAAIANGLAYDGLFIPEVATFPSSSTTCGHRSGWPPCRSCRWSLSSPTTQSPGRGRTARRPIEHLAALHAIPNVQTWRPANPAEVAAAWGAAMLRRDGPSALLLTRQKLLPVKRDQPLDSEALLRGGYAVLSPAGATFNVIATGSEVGLAQAAIELLAQKGKVGRLISIPCLGIHGPAAGGARRRVAARPPYGGGGGGARAGMVAAHRA